MQVFQGRGKAWQLLEREEGTLAFRRVDQSCTVLAHVAPGPRLVSGVWGVWPGAGPRAPVASSVRTYSLCPQPAGSNLELRATSSLEPSTVPEGMAGSLFSLRVKNLLCEIYRDSCPHLNPHCCAGAT